MSAVSSNHCSPVGRVAMASAWMGMRAGLQLLRSQVTVVEQGFAQSSK